MLQLLSENQKYGMPSHKIILKYESCKHQENIHLVRKQILLTNPVNAFVHKLFKIMEILFAFGLVIIFTEWDNRNDKHICQLIAILIYSDTAHILPLETKKPPKFAEFLVEKDDLSSLHSHKRSNQGEQYAITLFFSLAYSIEKIIIYKVKSQSEIFLI